MADGTRAKVLDDAVKSLQESHNSMRRDMDEQKSMLKEVLAQLAQLPNKGTWMEKGDSSGHSSSFRDGDGFSVLGRHKPAPVQLSRFTGTTPERWASQAQRYFDFYHIDEPDRITISSFYFDGDAADWFDWFDKNFPRTSWPDFLNTLVHRFKSRDLESPEGQLAKLQQSSTVDDYRHRFEEISNRSMVLPAPFLVSCFISGLRADIKQSVLIHRPATLEDAMDLAQLHERRISLEKGVGRPYLGSGKGILPTPKTGILDPPPLQSVLPKSSNPNSQIGFRRLTQTEMAQKRAQGLCYRCDEKYTRDHNCKATPQLLFFDDDPDPQSTDSPVEDATLANQPQVAELQSAISYNALSGGFSSTTLRFSGKVQGKPVQILLDGGSTHCFVQTRVASFLNFPIETISPFHVLVGSGEKLLCSGIAKNIEVVVQDQSIFVDFYVLPLQGWDMVLGVSWLSTLGPVITDYGQGIFEFNLGDKRVVWKGDLNNTAHEIQFNGLRRLAHTNGIGAMFHLQLLDPSSPVSPTYPPDLDKVLAEFTDVFQPPTGLPPSRNQDHRIQLLPYSNPVSVKPYRYPHFQKQEIERLVADMLQQGIIKPSTSPFSSPVLLVRKKDGTWRFCVDYRALNSITVPDRFPIPSIDELFDELFGAQYFSKLDLLAGYHQIRVHSDDTIKTAFRTHDGHYEFLVMPFGLTNAPSTFQRLMNDIFRPYLRSFVLVFFDDILVYSRSWEDHLHHIRVVLQTLREHRLVAKLSKCVFGQTSIGYLGHVISHRGVAVDPEKIQAIRNWPTPTTVKDIRSFLGLAGYYRRFIKNFATIASPLTDLLKKDSFLWSQSATDAFIQLKELLSSTPVLHLPDFNRPFTVETDASGTGIGAILSQDQHPLAYFSQKLCTRMQNASAYHREMFAITQAVAKWRQYLLGRRFVIITDQQALRNLQDQVIQTPEQHKWLGKLLGFDFEIIYRPGKHNTAADALSRVSAATLFALSSRAVSFIDQLKEANQTHPELLHWQQQLKDQASSCSAFKFKDGLLFYNDRLVVPANSPLRQQLLMEFHSSPTGGHAGITRTFHRLAANFFWKHMRQDVTNFIHSCHICQQTKTSSLSPAGLLQPLPIPELVFESIALDFITCLPPSHGKTVIMVVVDRLSKYGHFIALPSSFSSSTVAEAFVNEIVRLHGIPTDIVTDRDPRFMTDFWNDLHRLQGTHLSFSSAYHPQSDGQTEVLNKTLEMYLRCYVLDHPKDWFRFLPWAEFWYNTSFQTSAKMSPFEVLYGRKPPTVARYLKDSTGHPLLEAQLLERDAVLTTLKINLSKAQSKMKLAADSHRRDVQFQVNDWVYIKLQPYRQGSVRLQRHHKLGRRFFGPYQVLARIGKVAYKLALPEAAKIHPVFHVSLLRKCVGTPDHQVTPLHLVDSTSTMILQPMAVLAHRTIQRSGQPIPQCLIQWEGLSTNQATWEDHHTLLSSFPNLHLGDKVNFKEGGNAMTSPNETKGSGPKDKPSPEVKIEPRRSTREKYPSKRLSEIV
ncbi:putative nucleotidyltransferase, Ribonuclease H [Helianthus annuus]|nr:putative nucleotidyltransferase, Ribonuclease H [Helianthus annuus]